MARPLLPRILLLAVAYLATAQVAIHITSRDGGPVVWFAMGLAVAALLRLGLRSWPGVLVGTLVSNLVLGHDPLVAVAVATASSAAALLGAWLLTRTSASARFWSLRDAVALFAVAAVVPTLNASAGVTAMWLEGTLPDWEASFARWAMGDALGILLAVPLLTRAGELQRRTARRLARASAELAALAALAALEVLVWTSSVPRFWLLMPMMLWLTLRHGTAGATAVSLVTAMAAVWITRAGEGPFTGGEHEMLEVQLFALFVSGMLLTVAAVTGERRRAMAELRKMAQEDAALRHLATQVASGAPLTAVCDLAAAEAADLLDAEMTTVVRFVPGDAEIEVLGLWKVDELDLPAFGERVPVAPGSAVARVRAFGATARFDERGRTPTMPPLTQRIAAPVRADGRLWGALVVGTAGSDDLAPDADDRLERFARLVGLAIADAENRARLVAQATTDPLTGLLNHRAFHERLRDEVALARRQGRPLSVAVFDVDRFKEVNDTLGHHVGDRVLAEAARRMRGVVREGEVLARIGGDELALLLPGAGGDEAHAAAERLRDAVGAEPYELAGVLSASAGVCDVAHAGFDAERLVALADGALYWAKAHGRDACYAYDPDVVAELSADERAERLERSRALAAVRALARAIDAKDEATIRHSERVADLACRLAEASDWPAARIARLRDAALVHDVGKIGVPDAILSKPGRLTDEEYAIVQRHSELGATIAGEVLDDEEVAWVRGHHERHDGGGYPDRLDGEQISDGARLLALADAWDAMTGARVYSAALDPEAAMAEVRRNRGAQFHPDAVDALERLGVAAAVAA